MQDHYCSLFRIKGVSENLMFVYFLILQINFCTLSVLCKHLIATNLGGITGPIFERLICIVLL